MVPAIGRATGKWFGSRATGPTTADNGFTATTSAASIVAITTWIAITIWIGITTEAMTAVTIGTTTVNQVTV